MENFRLRGGFFLILTLAIVFFSFGCQVKTYTVLKERPDQEMSGNKGYLFGEPPVEERAITPRTTYVLEVEFGKGSDVEVKKTSVEDTYVEPAKVKAKAEEPVVIKALPNFK
ncbi:MAG: hypothetical protein ABIA97_00425 [Candidatus Omnitrophota bacterium]